MLLLKPNRNNLAGEGATLDDQTILTNQWFLGGLFVTKGWFNYWDR